MSKKHLSTSAVLGSPATNQAERETISKNVIKEYILETYNYDSTLLKEACNILGINIEQVEANKKALQAAKQKLTEEIFIKTTETSNTEETNEFFKEVFMEAAKPYNKQEAHELENFYSCSNLGSSDSENLDCHGMAQLNADHGI